MSRIVSFRMFALLGFAALSLVALAVAKSPSGNAAPACGCCKCGFAAVPTSASTDDDSADPSSPTMAADGSAPPAAPAKTDQELIAKQKICPVTGHALGSMGAPVKMKVKDRTVFLCCAGCKARFSADPDKYVKIIDEYLKKIAEQQSKKK